LRIGLQIGTASEFVPEESEWYALLEVAYPFGEIRIYPSKNKGITVTFPHQDLNLPGSEKHPWREGKLCLDSPIQRLGRIAGGQDPIGDREERFRWYLTRALEWLKCACTDSLMQDGDPFEIPYYSCNTSIHVVHNESRETYRSWKPYSDGSIGIVVFYSISRVENTDIAVAFETMEGSPIRKTNLFSEELHGSKNRKRRTGFWWLWTKPVTIPPWQVPINWKELRSAGNDQGIDVNHILRTIAQLLRGKDAATLLIGYPVPLVCGEEPCEIYWQAIKLPRLESTKKPPKSGFRATENNFWKRDHQKAFSDQKDLLYLKTENWHPDRMQARGRLNPALCDTKIALIGCGALGSIVAELLVREGVSDIILVDNKTLNAHNLVRHTLYGNDLGKNKVDALADRLSSSYPFAKITPVNKPFPNVTDEIETLLDDRKVVIDCTGSDDVIHLLAKGWWSIPRLFVSASVGYKAIRTFIFVLSGHEFPAELFHSVLEPYLAEERKLWEENGETLEGPGCWSPLFPARFDDLLLSASASIKIIEECICNPKPDAQLVVFEQTFSNGHFTGFERKNHSCPYEKGGE
jgi:hypothetical protein